MLLKNTNVLKGESTTYFKDSYFKNAKSRLALTGRLLYIIEFTKYFCANKSATCIWGI